MGVYEIFPRVCYRAVTCALCLTIILVTERLFVGETRPYTVFL